MNRLLRIGVVELGSVIIDKTFEPGETVTIGLDDATIPIEDFLPEVPELFVPTPSGLMAIRFDPAIMSGWVEQSRSAERKRLASFTGDRPDQSVIIPLAQTARGVITIGATSVIFHFVNVARPTTRRPLATPSA